LAVICCTGNTGPLPVLGRIIGQRHLIIEGNKNYPHELSLTINEYKIIDKLRKRRVGTRPSDLITPYKPRPNSHKPFPLAPLPAIIPNQLFENLKNRGWEMKNKITEM